MKAFAFVIAALIAGLAVSGCIQQKQHLAPPQPVTLTDPATTQAVYWFDQPAEARIESDNFDALVKTIETILRDYCFVIDRVDYRLGLITTEPLVGAQFFEPWRRDNQTMDDVINSSLATHRRLVRVKITRDGDRFIAEPKVVMERAAQVEQRVTNVVAYRTARRPTDPRDVPRGSRELDQGILIPSKYWYAVSRDPALEKKLAAEIQSYLAGVGG